MHIVASSLGIFCTLLLLSTSSTSHAFSVTPAFSLSQNVKPSSTKLHLFFDSEEYHEDEDDLLDLEKARARLEELVGDEDGQQQMQTVERPTVRSPTYRQSPLPTLDVVLPPAPPLTTIERERREVELQLLAKLEEGDDAVDDLWTLWFGERGSVAASKLVQADELSKRGPEYWKQAEVILKALIAEHGVYWAEPVNRLATLYYQLGRLDEAETLCHVVLAVKPWHFGTLSNIVMIYAAKQESDNARLWAASRLPTFAPTGANRRRVAWTDKAVQSAKQSLENAEKRVQDLFGEADDYTVEPSNWEEDAWQ